ncbi:MAG: hypothetical protein E6Q88_08735 [Lysobacteraceae bacterium]|nr:MAG: hypothetical protein E6Q88_08735 [Xanthomonadaceae bacterium]
MFNPNPKIQRIPIAGRHVCYAIDDVLADPRALVDYAQAQRAQFVQTAHNAYPGPELRMPDAFSAQLDDFFTAHLRKAFAVRRTERMYSRLAITATAPQALSPRQTLCHIDRMDLERGQCAIATVLYLFRNPELGGTAFYLPKRPLQDTVALIADSIALDDDAFRARYGLPGGYMTRSNAWFEKTLMVPARYNRMLVYEGTVFHSGEIAHPELLRDDPETGRLTLNGFFLCRRSLSG